MIRIPGYTLKKKLGIGGMATVYLAVQKSLQREVAMKVMAPALAADRNFAKRFVGEARTIAELNHPNIVSIHDVGITDDHLHYFAMQYCPGGDLSDRIEKGVDEKEVIRVLLGVCGALSHAHKRGFVHRDVTPGNILFDLDDNPVLTDFGIARVVSESTRMTATGLSLGTSHYMSPEQARGRRVDFRSDIYSLGAVCFETLTGHPPYEGDDSFSVAYSHVYDPVPQVPDRLKRWQTFVEGCMAKDPADRYQSMDEVSAVLQGFLKRLTGSGRKTPPDPDEVTSAVDPAAGPTHRPAPDLAHGAAAAAMVMAVSADKPDQAPVDPDATVAMPIQAPAHPANDPAAHPADHPAHHIETRIERLKWLRLALGSTPRDWIRGFGTSLRWGVVWVTDITGGRLPVWVAAAAVLILVAVGGSWWIQRPLPEEPMVVEQPIAEPVIIAPIQDDAAQQQKPVEVIASVEPDEPVLVDLGADPATDDSMTDAVVEAAMTHQFRQRIVDLLADANRFFEDNELTTPAQDNAFERFQAVLLLDPDNMQAKEGLKRIVDRYVALSRSAIAKGRYQSSMNLMKRGRRVAQGAGIESQEDAMLKSILQLGYDSAVARGEKAMDAGKFDKAEEAFAGALLFRPDDPLVSEALATLWPAAKPAGPRILNDSLADASSGPRMVVVEAAGLAFGVTEVTVAEFRRFRESSEAEFDEGACRHMESFFRASRKRTWENPGFEQDDDHPVVCVSWDEARAYAQWLSLETGFHYRLPTEAEWRVLVAASDFCSANHGDAALGEAAKRRRVLDCDDGFSYSAPAGSFSASPQGAYDVAGNVREWAADCKKGKPERCRGRAVMGSAWLDSSAKDLGSTVRSFAGGQRFTSVGFRLVRETAQPVAGD